jgi:hypothetical protein
MLVKFALILLHCYSPPCHREGRIHPLSRCGNDQSTKAVLKQVRLTAVMSMGFFDEALGKLHVTRHGLVFGGRLCIVFRVDER